MQNRFVHLTAKKWGDLIPPSNEWQFIIKILSMKEENLKQAQKMQEDFLKQTWLASPLIISVAGSVSVGKSTFAEELRHKLVEYNSTRKIQVVSADSFIMSNSELKAKNLMDEKGFPSSFDWESMANFLAAVKSSTRNIPYRVYSHELSDLSDKIEYIDQPDILIIEGINMLQKAPGNNLSPNDFVDFSIYLDASRENLENWYLERFHQMMKLNKDNPGNFFYQWAHKPLTEADNFAHEVWRTVNLKNLNEYIAPTKERADMILRKNYDHSVSDIYLRKI
ncbi:type I pantothenate kinase [Lactobacillus sp.]|uniref:type I pantothenate kinase n=1 Tax=Lactobacillus sp. TaxID=1591 RepID=UPI001986B9A7|nr:type I pantothenate kinase [Lactobacillus sp.]MBD5430712.1 type I pantothenate kinase [Lactobacillus sp.]